MKLAIVDDNPEELQKLYRTIMDYSCTHDVAIACDRFATSAAFLSACAQISYSFVIFDIYLQDTTGIDLAAEFRRIAPRTPIVFLTSSPEHRADAFRVHAFDYLEKPVTGEMIARLFDELAITQEEETDTQVFSISIDRKQIPVLYSDIRYITSDSNYLQIQGRDVFRCRMPFREAASILTQDERFLTINRGILINLDYVQHMENTSCTMCDSTTFSIHRKNAAAITQAYIAHQFKRRTKDSHEFLEPRLQSRRIRHYPPRHISLHHPCCGLAHHSPEKALSGTVTMHGCSLFYAGVGGFFRLLLHKHILLPSARHLSDCVFFDCKTGKVEITLHVFMCNRCVILRLHHELLHHRADRSAFQHT